MSMTLLEVQAFPPSQPYGEVWNGTTIGRSVTFYSGLEGWMDGSSGGDRAKSPMNRRSESVLLSIGIA